MHGAQIAEPLVEELPEPSDTPGDDWFRGPGKILDAFRASAGIQVPVLASWTNPRIAGQEGCFTLQCGARRADTSPLDQIERRSPERYLLQVRIPAGRVADARRALRLLGVRRDTLFPEVEAVCGWIKSQRGLG